MAAERGRNPTWQSKYKHLKNHMGKEVTIPRETGNDTYMTIGEATLMSKIWVESYPTEWN